MVSTQQRAGSTQGTEIDDAPQRGESGGTPRRPRARSIRVMASPQYAARQRREEGGQEGGQEEEGGEPNGETNGPITLRDAWRMRRTNTRPDGTNLTSEDLAEVYDTLAAALRDPRAQLPAPRTVQNPATGELEEKSTAPVLQVLLAADGHKIGDDARSLLYAVDVGCGVKKPR